MAKRLFHKLRSFSKRLTKSTFLHGSRFSRINLAIFALVFASIGAYYLFHSHAAGPGLPTGVTLQQIDGGPNYYCSNGFTYACNAGWDSPSFFPIGPWYGNITSQSDVNRWKDLGINTAYRTTGNTNLPLMKSNGLWAIVNNGETPNQGTESVGLLSADEPPDYSTGVSGPLGSTSNSVQDGRFWYMNDTWNFIHYGGLSPVNSSSQVLSNLITTPNGTKRHIDIQSADIYWFAGVPSSGGPYEGQLLYNLGSNMTASQMRCGCRYGDTIRPVYGSNIGMNDSGLASMQTTYPAPVYNFVENGGPYTEDTSASYYATPPELNWGVWSNIIHGARGIIYFNHTFAGPAISDDNLAQSYYQTVQTGQTTSIYAQTKATDAVVKQFAPYINDPTALGYVTTNPSPATFGGVETRATYDQSSNNFYIFADTRDAETQTNIATTYTVAGGYSGLVTATSAANNATTSTYTLTATNGVFSDPFAKASDVHIYQIPNTASGNPAPTVSLTANPTTISSGQSSTLSWSSTNATSCSATTPSGWTSSTAASGTQSVSPTTTTTYTITCTGAGGSTPASATVTVNSSSVTGDLNGDGHVNIFDLSIFLTHWQQTGSGIPEDFNNDNIVNIFDLSILLSNYGT